MSETKTSIPEFMRYNNIRKLWETSKQSQNRRGEYQVDEITHAKGGYSKCVHMCTKGRGLKKLVIRYVRTNWMAPSKCCRIFFVHRYKYTRASPPARKMHLFSSIITMIILSYAISYILFYPILFELLTRGITCGFELVT